MEATTASSTQAVMYFVIILMGYAIALSYVFIAITKKEIRHLRKENESKLKHLEERMETKYEWMQSDITKITRDSHKIKSESS